MHLHSRTTSLIGLLWLGTATAAPIPADQWQPGTLATLTDAGLTVAIPDDSEVGGLLQGLKTPLALAPGVYSVHAAVRAEPLRNMGYRLVLTVRSATDKGTYERWRPRRSCLTPRPKELWCAVTTMRAAQHAADGLVHLRAEFAATAPDRYHIAVGWKNGETAVGTRFLKWAEAPASLDRMQLRKLESSRLPRTVLIDELMADKLVYKPGGEPVLQATIANTSAAAQTLAFRVRQTWDIEPAEVVATGTVELPARATTQHAIKLPALTAFGGYRFDLDLLDGETVVHTCERAAACSPRFNRIGIRGIYDGEYIAGTVNATKDRVVHAFANSRRDYVGWHEIGFWAPDDFQNLTPEKERYISSTMAPQRRSHIKYVCDAGKRYGIGVFMYLKGNYADGRDGIEWAQRYPELIYYHRDTGRPMGKYNLDHILNWDDYEDRIVNRRERVGNHWHYIRLDAGRPSVVDVSVDEALASQAMFGWAGVRFDGDFDVPVSDQYYEGPVRSLRGRVTATAADAEVAYANNVLRYKRKIREQLPEFEFGFNHCVDDSRQRWIAGPAIARDESMVMNEPIRGFGHSPERAYNRWQDFADVLVRYSRIVRSWGGYYQPIGCYGMRADDYLYQSVYVLAAQAKPYGPFDFSSAFTRRLSRFVTRFAGILCGELHPVPGAEGRVTLTASAPLEWQRYVSYREVSRRRRDYVVQMINPPVPERARSTDTRCLLRPPVTRVHVELDLDPFEIPAWACLLDPWHLEDLVPVPVRRAAGRALLDLPEPVRVWSVLVLSCDLKETRP